MLRTCCCRDDCVGGGEFERGEGVSVLRLMSGVSEKTIVNLMSGRGNRVSCDLDRPNRFVYLLSKFFHSAVLPTI